MDIVQAVRIFAYVAVACIIFALLWWLVDFTGLPSPFGHVLHVILVVLAVFVLVGVLLKLVGKVDGGGPSIP